MSFIKFPILFFFFIFLLLFWKPVDTLYLDYSFFLYTLAVDRSYLLFYTFPPLFDSSFVHLYINQRKLQHEKRDQKMGMKN